MYNIILSKQAEKYFAKSGKRVQQKLQDALDDLAEFKGDIVKLKGKKNEYRIKIPQFRIIFTYNKGEIEIKVIRINPRGDVYKKGGN